MGSEILLSAAGGDHGSMLWSSIISYRFGVVCCVVVRGELERLDSTPLTGPLILPHVDWINRYAPMPCHHMKMVDIASASS